MDNILSHKGSLDSFLKTYLAEQKGSIYHPVEYILELGGKRLRPCLLLAVVEALGEKPSGALPLAAAIEVFHNFTLLHDDIMDDADQRRGKDAVHIRWSRDQAILSGDIMFAMSYELLAQYTSPRSHEILNLFTRTAKEVCVGQQMDMEFESRSDVTEAEYLEMIRLKTSVLLGTATGAAAMYADKDKATFQALYDFGLYLGLSFQLQDDLLDAFGREAAVGKRVGGDILQNKKTMLYLKATAQANPRDRKVLVDWYSKEIDSQKKIDEVKSIMKRSGALDEVRILQKEYQRMSIENLEIAGLTGPGYDHLRALVDAQDKREY